MRPLLTLIFISLAFNLSGQSLEKLEKDIYQTSIADIKTTRKKAYNILNIDPYNEMAISHLISAYKNKKLDDSVAYFFSVLKRLNPSSAIPYVLSAKYQFDRFTIDDTSKINELKYAVTLDPVNLEANYLLWTSYYILFHEQQKLYFAVQCRHYLIRTTQIDSTTITYLKYPIIQLSYFLNDTLTSSAYKNKTIEITTDNENIPTQGLMYYPTAPFLDLKDDWEKNSSLDLMQEVSIAQFILSWYSGNLRALKEPLVYNQKEKMIYRFTWLRSFDNPVAIRIEKNEKSCILYWKVTDGASGYDPGQLITDKSREISQKQWDTFISLLQSTDFWNMPTLLKTFGNDGAQWIIEGIANGKYHVVDRWSPQKTDFQKCGNYLIELAGLNITDKELY